MMASQLHGQVHARGFSWVRWGAILAEIASDQWAARGLRHGVTGLPRSEELPSDTCDALLGVLYDDGSDYTDFCAEQLHDQDMADLAARDAKDAQHA